VPVAADEGEAGAVHVAEVDDDDRVLGEVHVALDGGAGVDELGSAEVTDEDRVLESFAVFLHCLAHPA
jgi:hypothetical protein